MHLQKLPCPAGLYFLQIFGNACKHQIATCIASFCNMVYEPIGSIDIYNKAQKSHYKVAVNLKKFTDFVLLFAHPKFEYGQYTSNSC